jgi:hypothetical protein
MPLGRSRVVFLLTFSLAGAERWDLQYFYDKNDSALSFVDLQFPSAERGIAAGVMLEGRRVRPVAAVTSDGGRSWELLPMPQAPLSVFFLDERVGWLVSNGGRLWSTMDGGRTWTRARLDGVRAEPVRVFFCNATRGWLLCNRKAVYGTSDGGRSWKLIEPQAFPDAPAPRSVFTEAACSGDAVLLSGFTRPPGRQSRLPAWMEPELAPLGVPPTTAFALHSTDGGRQWKRFVFPDFGEIRRLRISPEGSAVALIHRPDSLTNPTAIFQLTLPALEARPTYADRNRWLTDVAFAGPHRMLAAAIDQEGRSLHPALPGKLRVLSSADGRAWSEMEMDYRAEAHHAVLAARDADHAWIATDTGMILRWVKE